METPTLIDQSTRHGQAHQRIIRERIAVNGDGGLFGEYWKSIDTNIRKANISEVTYATAEKIILEYEWLGNMGTTEFCYGISWEGIVAGVVCFGHTAGTNVYLSVCGEQYSNHAITLCRGACVHWAHPHSASKLISSACRMMLDHGYNIFIAYSDPDAGEIGTVYQASNWLYCGKTNATEKFMTTDGKIRDARMVHLYTRDRRGGTLKYKRTRAEQKRLMIKMGCKFFKGTPKNRYVRIIGRSRKEEHEIRQALRWPVLPYPKRAAEVSMATQQATSLKGEVQFLNAAACPQRELAPAESGFLL